MISMSKPASCWVVTWRSKGIKILEKTLYEDPIPTFIDSLRDLTRTKITSNHSYLGDGKILISIITKDAVVYVRIRITSKDTSKDDEIRDKIINYILDDEMGEIRHVIDGIERIEILDAMIAQLACEWMNEQDSVFRTNGDSINNIIGLAELVPESVTHETVPRCIEDYVI